MGQIIHGFMVLFGRTTLPIGTFVIGISQIKAATGSNPDIIGSVEQLALVIFDDYLAFAGGVDPPEFIFFIGASPKLIMRIEAKAAFTFDNRTEAPLSAACALNVRYSGISSGCAADDSAKSLRRE